MEEKALMGGWYQRKTNRDSYMGHVRDKEHWSLDVIVMLSVMLIVGDDRNAGIGSRDMMFPFVHRLSAKNTTAFLNDSINQAKGKAEGLNKDSTSHHARYGGLSDIQVNKDLDFIDSIFRGKWHFQGECTGLNYADKAPGCLRAGKALAGWKSCKEVIESLDIFELLDEFIDDDDADESKVLLGRKLENLAGSLFKTLPYCENKDQHLFKVRNIFLTAIIEMAPKIISDLKVFHNDNDYEDIFEKILKHALSSVQVSWTEFLCWSKKVSLNCDTLLLKNGTK